MYFKMPCWSCGRPLRASDENIGKNARCPYCGTVGVIERPELRAEEPAPGPLDELRRELAAPAGGEPPAEEKREGGQSRGTNISLPLTAMIGLGATAAFYLAFILPIPDNPVRRIFANRGLVPYVITFLTFWAWAMLVLKYRKLRAQRSALLFDVLPTEVANEIHPDNVEAFRANILSLPIEPERSFLIGRVLRALNHYKVHPTRESVSTLLANQSEIEANIVESSYSMVKVLVWAIPILGFIGTVMGVGAAVGSFSDVIGQAEKFSHAKEGLSRVTTNLGVAFDTTLLALIMSLFVMFPASALQKNEEDLLSSVDQYCNENILRRLSGSPGGPDRPADAGAIAGAVDRVLSQRTRELRAWAKELEGMSQRLTEDIATTWGRVGESLERVHREQLASASESCEQMVGSVTGLQSRLADASRNVAELSELQERLAQLNQQLLANLEAMADDGALKEALLGIDRQLARNSEVLETLGSRVNASAEVRPRGWWPFSRRNRRTREDG